MVVKGVTIDLFKQERKSKVIKTKEIEITELKQQLARWADKYQKLNIEHTKQQEIWRQQIEEQQRGHSANLNGGHSPKSPEDDHKYDHSPNPLHSLDLDPPGLVDGYSLNSQSDSVQ